MNISFVLLLILSGALGIHFAQKYHKNSWLYALIGILIMGLSYAISAYLLTLLFGADFIVMGYEEKKDFVFIKSMIACFITANILFYLRKRLQKVKTAEESQKNIEEIGK